jgi:hypothetical protein
MGVRGVITSHISVYSEITIFTAGVKGDYLEPRSVKIKRKGQKRGDAKKNRTMQNTKWDSDLRGAAVNSNIAAAGRRTDTARSGI